MFKDIEKNYKKNLRETKFNKFYWITSFLLILGSSLLQISDNIKPYFIYTLLFIFVIGYFIINYIKTMKNVNIKKKINIIEKLKIYSSEVEKQNINNIILLLKQYNFKTKNDLKLAIDYYNSEKPIKVESDYLGWIVSISLTLSSFIEIAYNTETQAIDTTKISVILGSALGIIIGFLIPIIIFKIIINKSFTSKKTIRSNLSDDLSYIYLNFDKYKNQLSKKQ
ncbi:MAG: hypothetical protein ACLT1G_05895 [Bacilli bacterium]